jgi:hypothetical protein
MRPLSSCRPGSALQKRPMSGNRLPTSRPYSDPVNDIMNDASELTIGPTIYGNPLRGLIARRKPKVGKTENESVKTKNPSKNQTSQSENENDSELFKELKSWRKEHER